MSVSWLGSNQGSTHQLGLYASGGQSKSSSDYGSWFQPRASIVYPTMGVPIVPSGTIPTRIPIRKLGELSRVDSTYTTSALRREISDQVGLQDNIAEQSGKVSSFLDKVTQEDLFPKAPKTPDMLDLPGRMVRVPKTRHMTPRTSPDSERYEEMITPGTSDGRNALAEESGRLAPRYGMERNNTMLDMSPMSYQGQMSQHIREPTSTINQYTLPQTDALLATTSNNSSQQLPLNPIGQRYTIPKFPLKRSNTLGNLQISTKTNNLTNHIFREDNHISPLSHQQLPSTTILEDFKFAQVPPINTTEHSSNNRLPRDLRRMHTFHGQLPSTGLQNGINMRHQTDTFQPTGVARNDHAPHASSYMFGTLPDYNTTKNEVDKITAGTSALSNPVPAQIPMYWLYGSRGKPSSREDLLHASSKDLYRQELNQPRQVSVDSTMFIPGMHGPHLQGKSESDFLNSERDRRDAYRSSYSSYLDQHIANDSYNENLVPTTSLASGMAPGMVPTMVPSELIKTRSILKKPSYYAMPSSHADIHQLRFGTGSEFSHLTKGGGSKRVTFAK